MEHSSILLSIPMGPFSTPEQIVARCQKVVAHAWVVRAFLRHADEAEDFPELGTVGREIFDFTRALEVKVADPAGYLKMLAKKLGKFSKAVEQFACDAPRVSSHTNFAQAVLSLETCRDDLQELLLCGQTLLSASLPANTNTAPPSLQPPKFVNAQATPSGESSSQTAETQESEA